MLNYTEKSLKFSLSIKPLEFQVNLKIVIIASIVISDKLSLFADDTKQRQRRIYRGAALLLE